MIPELLEWPVTDQKVSDLGEAVEDTYNEFDIILTDLGEALEEDRVPNRERPKQLRKTMKTLEKQALSINPVGSFDRLVLQNLRRAMKSQEIFLNAFFTDKLRNPSDVGGYLDAKRFSIILRLHLIVILQQKERKK